MYYLKPLSTFLDPSLPHSQNVSVLFQTISYLPKPFTSSFLEQALLNLLCYCYVHCHAHLNILQGRRYWTFVHIIWSHLTLPNWATKRMQIRCVILKSKPQWTNKLFNLVLFTKPCNDRNVYVISPCRNVIDLFFFDLIPGINWWVYLNVTKSKIMKPLLQDQFPPFLSICTKSYAHALL